MLNHVVLMGRLVADPELQHTPNDIALTRVRIACDRNYARQGEERKTDFIDVTFWRGTAEFVCKYFAKGRMIALEGSLRVDNYTDREGNKRTRYYVEGSDVYFADSKQSSGSGGSYTPAPAPADSALPQTGYSSGEADDFSIVEDDDDLPF
ncbi:MAG: single-stranded DNA-binding protein [Oscillospiraceae bacterium]|nr:single-stranded DNA-binding protein [Oscillospiraceae bacterium]